MDPIFFWSACAIKLSVMIEMLSICAIEYVSTRNMAKVTKKLNFYLNLIIIN